VKQEGEKSTCLFTSYLNQIATIKGVRKMGKTNKISSVWTLVYKEEDSKPLAFSYTSEKDALIAKSMVEESNGGEYLGDDGEVEGWITIEWCYLINGKLIE
jgi:hypothetical protein